MAVSIGGALRSVIVAANLPNIGTKIYRDIAPDAAVPPYLTFMDLVSSVPALEGDGRTLFRQRMIQVDLWQMAAVESDTLADQLIAAVDGARLSGTAGQTLRVQVQDVQRIPQLEDGYVKVAVTLIVVHN